MYVLVSNDVPYKCPASGFGCGVDAVASPVRSEAQEVVIFLHSQKPVKGKTFWDHQSPNMIPQVWQNIMLQSQKIE